jgi:hypothetical protein
MKSTKSPPDTGPDGNALLQYESMRSQTLNRQEIFHNQSLGHTLLIRQGMLAWIDVCHKCIPEKPKSIKRSKAPFFSNETTSEMIKVMANITLFNLEEVYP